MITKKEVVEKRRQLFKTAKRKHTFNKGDRRVHTPRICVICGCPLSSLIVRNNSYITIHKHTRFHINDIVILDACTDINSCYRTLEQKGELIKNVNGRQN